MTDPFSPFREELLALNEQNFAIPYERIQKFVFRAGRESVRSGDDYSVSTLSGKIIIRHDQGKLKFSHEEFDADHGMQSIFKDIFGSKLKYR